MIEMKVELLDNLKACYSAYVDGQLFGCTFDDDVGFSLLVATHKINFAKDEAQEVPAREM